MKLSFFFKSGRSGLIRGRQMAEYLGAKSNPESDYENDVCIYVKMQPPEEFPEKSYLDVMDEGTRLTWLLKHPKIGVVACSESEHEYLTEKLERDDIVLIPQHHCNYERIRRTRKTVRIAGVIGRPTAIRHPIDEIRERFAKIGIEFRMETNYKDRQDVVDFYKELDVQIVWRPLHRWFKNALKLVNAGSFGIPTVTFPEVGYKELEGYYLPANTIEEMVGEVRKLKKSESLYQDYAGRLIEKTEEYHISKIARLYLTLSND